MAFLPRLKKDLGKGTHWLRRNSAIILLTSWHSDMVGNRLLQSHPRNLEVTQV